MDFIDEIKALATRVPKKLEHLQTEEATKNALVMPFINALGYNVFDPTEVMPEFVADVGTKKGEKVDYAIMKDGTPIILFECKRANADLEDEQASQLFRYFTSTDVRFGVLTNGIVYRFYSDLDEPNKMDLRPFFELSMLDISDNAVNELKRFTKSSFDLDENVEAATILKYTKGIMHVLSQQLRDPSDDFVKLVADDVYSGIFTQSVREQFSQLTKQAFQQFINERIDDRLKSALAHESGDGHESPSADFVETDDPDIVAVDRDRGIVTTQEEMDGYLVVKAILRETVDVSRVAMRDTRSYCGILLDDNNRKTICRLHFNAEQKYLGVLDEQRQEERIPIDSIDSIFKYADQLKVVVARYDAAS